MYIQSKLKESSKSLFSLDLSDGVVSESPVFEEIELRKKSVFVKGNINHSNDLFIADIQLKSAEKTNIALETSNDCIYVLHLKQGNAKTYLTFNESKRLLIKSDTSISWGFLPSMPDDVKLNIKVEDDKYINFSVVLLSTQKFLELLGNEKWAKEYSLFEKVKSGNLFSFGKLKNPVAYDLHNLFIQLTQNNFSTNFSIYFLKLRIKELFLKLLSEENQQISETSKFEAPAHVDKIKKAYYYLSEHFINPPTIKSLSREVVLNELQLKNGFKQLYGKTIRQYVIELKMKKAKTLLGDYTVAEMAGILGYKSVPHFINMYKKYYGCTPSKSIRK